MAIATTKLRKPISAIPKVTCHALRLSHRGSWSLKLGKPMRDEQQISDKFVWTISHLNDKKAVLNRLTGKQTNRADLPSWPYWKLLVRILRMQQMLKRNFNMQVIVSENEIFIWFIPKTGPRTFDKKYIPKYKAESFLVRWSWMSEMPYASGITLAHPLRKCEMVKMIMAVVRQANRTSDLSHLDQGVVVLTSRIASGRHTSFFSVSSSQDDSGAAMPGTSRRM